MIKTSQKKNLNECFHMLNHKHHRYKKWDKKIKEKTLNIMSAYVREKKKKFK